MTTRAASSLEQFSRELWERHEARRQRPAFRELWPTTRDFKEHWPLLAPPDPGPRDWHQLYRAELQEHPGIAWDLAQENPLGKAFKRARLSPLEADAFRLYAAGDSVRAIARTLGRQRRTVDSVIQRAQFKLRELAFAGLLEQVL